MARDDGEVEQVEITGEIPVLPVRNTVLFPRSIVPIDVARERSIAAVERANGPGKFIAIVTQKDAADEGPDPRLHAVGCAARVLKVIKLKKDNLAVILQGLRRIRIPDVDRSGPFLVARVETVPEPDGLGDDVLLRKMQAVKESALQMIAMMPEMPKEATALFTSIKRPGALADVLASHLDLSVDDRQKVLETIPLAQRLDLVFEQVKQTQARLG